jgi:hypothetical protein
VAAAPALLLRHRQLLPWRKIHVIIADVSDVCEFISPAVETDTKRLIHFE